MPEERIYAEFFLMRRPIYDGGKTDLTAFHLLRRSGNLVTETTSELIF